MEPLIKTPWKCQLRSWAKGGLRMKMTPARQMDCYLSTSVHGKQETQTSLDTPFQKVLVSCMASRILHSPSVGSFLHMRISTFKMLSDVWK